jgi:uncharacterized protein
MTRRHYALLSLVLCVIVMGLLWLRNYQLDLGARALKEDKGLIAEEHLRPLARLGDTTAQYLLGNIYAYGWGGVKKNDAEAIYWFKRAAMFVEDETDPAAPAELAIAKSYAEGTDGVKVDKIESIKWLRLAAMGGSKEAASLLAKPEQH